MNMSPPIPAVTAIRGFASSIAALNRSCRRRCGRRTRPASGCSSITPAMGSGHHRPADLRLHGLIERLPNSFRYRVTDFGFRAALFFTRLYNRLLRPGLAAALPTLRAADGPLKRAFDTVNAQINVSIKQAQLAT